VGELSRTMSGDVVSTIVGSVLLVTAVFLLGFRRIRPLFAIMGVLALCCDILVASEVAYLAMTEVDVGLAGGVSHVRRFFRESDARLLIYTARRMSGPELYRMGVVSECVSADALLETAQRIAHEIAAKSPSAVRAAKRSFNVTEDMPLREGYRFEQSQTVALASTEDTKEAQRAFAEKRQPVFRGG